MRIDDGEGVSSREDYARQGSVEARPDAKKGTIRLRALPDHSPLRAGHAILFATSLPLFLGALLADWAYSSTYSVQWINFASWLNAGALVVVGAALAWLLLSWVRSGFKRGNWLVYILLVALTFIVGFFNALVHAKDAWASMPTGLILSIIVFLLALAAAWVSLNNSERGAVR